MVTNGKSYHNIQSSWVLFPLIITIILVYHIYSYKNQSLAVVSQRDDVNEMKEILKREVWEKISQLKFDFNVSQQDTHPLDEQNTFDQQISPSDEPSIHYEWTAPNGKSLAGKDFALYPGELEGMDISMTHFPSLPLPKDKLEKFVFALASSYNTFEMTRRFVYYLQNNFPSRQIFLCDVLLKKQRRETANSWCDIDYYALNFSSVPSHFHSGASEAYRPFCVIEALRRHDAIMWLDHDTNIKIKDFKPIVDHFANNKAKSMALFTPVDSLSITDGTDSKTYTYLPSDVEKLSKIGLFHSKIFFAVKTENLYRNVLRWWALCAIDEECLVPFESAHSSCYGSDLTNCHYNATSTLNVLLANHYKHDKTKYIYPDGGGMFVANETLKGLGGKQPRRCD